MEAHVERHLEYGCLLGDGSLDLTAVLVFESVLFAASTANG